MIDLNARGKGRPLGGVMINGRSHQIRGDIFISTNNLYGKFSTISSIMRITPLYVVDDNNLEYANLYIWVTPMIGIETDKFPPPSRLQVEHQHVIPQDHLLILTLPTAARKFLGLKMDGNIPGVEPVGLNHIYLEEKFDTSHLAESTAIPLFGGKKETLHLYFYDDTGSPVQDTTNEPVHFVICPQETGYNNFLHRYYPEMAFISYTPITMHLRPVLTNDSSLKNVYTLVKRIREFQTGKMYPAQNYVTGVAPKPNGYGYLAQMEPLFPSFFSFRHAPREMVLYETDKPMLDIIFVDYETMEDLNAGAQIIPFLNSYGFLIYDVSFSSRKYWKLTVGLPFLSEHGATFFDFLFRAVKLWGVFDNVDDFMRTRQFPRPMRILTVPKFSQGDDPCSNLKKWTFEVEIEI